MAIKTDQKGFARLVLAEILYRKLGGKDISLFWRQVGDYLPTEGYYYSTNGGLRTHDNLHQFSHDTDSANGWWCPPGFIPAGLNHRVREYTAIDSGWVDYLAVAVTDAYALVSWCLGVLGGAKEVLRFPADPGVSGKYKKGEAYRLSRIHHLSAGALVWLWGHRDKLLLEYVGQHRLMVLREGVKAEAPVPGSKLGLATKEYVDVLTKLVRKYPLFCAGLIGGVDPDDKYMRWSLAGIYNGLSNLIGSCEHSGVQAFWTNELVARLVTNKWKMSEDAVVGGFTHLESLAFIMGAMYFFDKLSIEKGTPLEATSDMLVGLHRVLRDTSSGLAATLSLDSSEVLKKAGLAAMGTAGYEDQQGLEKALTNKIRATAEEYFNRRNEK